MTVQQHFEFINRSRINNKWGNEFQSLITLNLGVMYELV